MGLVAAVVTKEAPASELGHLFADELLFVVAIAQELLGDGGVKGHALEQVVAAQPGFKLGELGVGFDQVVAGVLRAYGVYASNAQGTNIKRLLPMPTLMRLSEKNTIVAVGDC